MIALKPMSEAEFESFRIFSQNHFASSVANAEGLAVEESLKNAAELFTRLVPNGLKTPGQLFFEAVDETSGRSIGYLWLGFVERYGRKIASINDIQVNEECRGRGFGKELMMLAEQEARKAGAVRVRLHVFHFNEVARHLYEDVGFQVTSLDMSKEL